MVSCTRHWGHLSRVILCSSRYPQLVWCGIDKLIPWLYPDTRHSGTDSWKDAVGVSLSCSCSISGLLRGLKLPDCQLYGCSNPNILFLSYSSEQVGRSSPPRLKGKGIPSYKMKSERLFSHVVYLNNSPGRKTLLISILQFNKLHLLANRFLVPHSPCDIYPKLVCSKAYPNNSCIKDPFVKAPLSWQVIQNLEMTFMIANFS